MFPLMVSFPAYEGLFATNFYFLFSPCQELKKALSDIKTQLDATAFDIQFFISEHAQDLTPGQSRQLLTLLNELQKTFRDLSERAAARAEVLQVCLQQAEQMDQVMGRGCSFSAASYFTKNSVGGFFSFSSKTGELPASVCTFFLCESFSNYAMTTEMPFLFLSLSQSVKCC